MIQIFLSDLSLLSHTLVWQWKIRDKEIGFQLWQAGYILVFWGYIWAQKSRWLKVLGWHWASFTSSSAWSCWFLSSGPTVTVSTHTDWFVLSAGGGDSDWWRWIVSLSPWAENVLWPDANMPQGSQALWVRTLKSIFMLVLKIVRRHYCSYADRQRLTGNWGQYENWVQYVSWKQDGQP